MYKNLGDLDEEKVQEKNQEIDQVKKDTEVLKH